MEIAWYVLCYVSIFVLTILIAKYNKSWILGTDEMTSLDVGFLGMQFLLAPIMVPIYGLLLLCYGIGVVLCKLGGK